MMLNCFIERYLKTQTIFVVKPKTEILPFHASYKTLQLRMIKLPRGVLCNQYVSENM